MRKLPILLLITLTAQAQAKAAPIKAPSKPKLTRSEVRAELQLNGARQELVRTTLTRLQSLKMNHIAKTKLATPNDRAVVMVYDRLIAAVEARYKSGDLADFLTRYSLQIAETEKRNNSNLIAFFSYLGDVVKSAKNDRADIISTIENYIRAAPVTDPLSAVRFILNNSYSNGMTNEAAVGYTREDAAPEIEAPAPLAGPEEAVTILPPLELPQMLPPMPDAPAESPAEPAAVTSSETTSNKVDKMNELVPEKTPAIVTTTPLIDNSAPSEPPVANTLSADSQAAYSASGQKPTLELPPKIE